jgi:hypothetical protein
VFFAILFDVLFFFYRTFYGAGLWISFENLRGCEMVGNFCFGNVVQGGRFLGVAGY